MNIIKSHPYWRFLEIIPGTMTWLALVLPIVLSFYFPEAVAIFVIVYTMLWLFRSLRLTFNLVRSYKRVLKAEQTDWVKLIEYVDSPKKLSYAIEALKKYPYRQVQGEIMKLKELQKGLVDLYGKNQYKTSKNILHAVLYVTYKENIELIRESMRSYISGTWPSNRIIFVFAGEERDQENFLRVAHALEQESGSKFFKFLVTVHPKDISGEIMGKSSNATYAAKQLKLFLDEHGVSYDDVILSNFDADTAVHRNYFAELTFKYLTTENRGRMTYQPLHLYHNNIWDVPAMIRLIALGNSFWRMAESMNRERYKSFSSRSMGFRLVTETGYWDPQVIPEDSRQYWTAYVLYNGAHYLVSLYSPLYMDAVLARTTRETFKQQYVQLRRWAWGVCDFPFVFLNLLKHPVIPLSKKMHHIFTLLESHFFWATAPFLLTFTGWLPGLISVSFRTTVLSYNLPKITTTILNVAAIGILICAILSICVVPKNPDRRFWGSVSLFLQWLLVPFSSIFLSAIPAIEAQTRLMFNKRLEYQVTPKERKLLAYVS